MKFTVLVVIILSVFIARDARGGDEQTVAQLNAKLRVVRDRIENLRQEEKALLAALEEEKKAKEFYAKIEIKGRLSMVENIREVPAKGGIPVPEAPKTIQERLKSQVWTITAQGMTFELDHGFMNSEELYLAAKQST